MADRTAALATADRIDAADLVLVKTLPPERQPALVYLARLRAGPSRATMRAGLERIAELITGSRDLTALPWHQLRYQHTAAIRTLLTERYSPAGVNLRLAALRGVLREAWRLGLTDAETYHRAADLPSVRGETLPQGRALTTGELRALFEVCQADESAAGARDAALLAVLYGAGLRRAEAVRLASADYNNETGELRVRSGKGGKDRLVYATNGGRAAIEAWIAHRGEADGPLFCPVAKGGRIELRAITPQAVLLVCRKRANQAGVDRFSPHDLRRTFVSTLIDAGADLVSVQRLAGHADLSTTARYDRRGEAAKRRAAQLLHVPFTA